MKTALLIILLLVFGAYAIATAFMPKCSDNNVQKKKPKSWEQ